MYNQAFLFFLYQFSEVPEIAGLKIKKRLQDLILQPLFQE